MPETNDHPNYCRKHNRGHWGCPCPECEPDHPAFKKKSHSETNDTCLVCGETWGEPLGIWVRMSRIERVCPADCYDEAKWKALAGLVVERDSAQMHFAEFRECHDKQHARISELEKQNGELENHLAYFIRADSWGAAYGARLGDPVVKRALAREEKPGE